MTTMEQSKIERRKTKARIHKQQQKARAEERARIRAILRRDPHSPEMKERLAALTPKAQGVVLPDVRAIAKVTPFCGSCGIEVEGDADCPNHPGEATITVLLARRYGVEPKSAVVEIEQTLPGADGQRYCVI